MRFSAQKMRELVLYLAKLQEDDETFGRVKLAKLLYYCDFEAYGYLRAPITGADYQKLPYGPGARQYRPIFDELLADGDATERIVDYKGKGQWRLVPLRDANTSVFTDDELRIIDDQVKLFWGATATEMSAKSHTEIGWRVARDGERIPYETVFLAPHADYEIVQIAKGLAIEHGWLEAG